MSLQNYIAFHALQNNNIAYTMYSEHTTNIHKHNGMWKCPQSMKKKQHYKCKINSNISYFLYMYINGFYWLLHNRRYIYDYTGRKFQKLNHQNIVFTHHLHRKRRQNYYNHSLIINIAIFSVRQSKVDSRAAILSSLARSRSAT